MPRKTIFLMGAPSGRLQWNEKDLLETAVPPFKPSSSSIASTSYGHGQTTTNWRVLERADGIQSSPHLKWTENTLFLDTANLNFTVPRTVDGDDDFLLSQFYEHSLSILEGSYSSESDNNDTTLALEDSGIESESSMRPHEATTNSTFPFIHPRELHDIKDIPNAAYLRSIIPQTPSVTLVVAIVGINPIRRVTARYSKQEIDLLELIVGDETRTGFGITFWLPVPKETRTTGAFSESNSEFREKICGLRLRDIVLIRNVGLGSFQDLVYGQSLQRGMTKVDLLHRQQADDYGAFSVTAIEDSTRSDDRLLNKVRNVRNWLINFVGAKVQYDSHRIRRPLPPDTQ